MAETFYSQISANKRNSFLLTLVIVVLFALLGFSIGYAIGGDVTSAVFVMVIALVVGGLLSVGSFFSGDSLVLAASSAKEVDATAAPQLLNVVQELALAANVPMPKVYIIDDTAPNAFATGRDPQHASVAITTGLLEKLDREELQGVIGHELSHVRNYDIRFALLVGVLVGSIALLADFFLRFTFWGGGRRSSNREGGSNGLQAIMFVVAIVLAILAPIASRLVQLAVNRQREYLADASSVALTRNPHGLERALAKISEDQEVLEVANRATQHMYFTNPIKKFEERSKRPVLDPPGDARPDQPAPRAHRRAAARRGRGGAAGRPRLTSMGEAEPEVHFFASPAELRDWFDANHETAAELWLGYHKKATGRPTRDVVGGGRRGPLRRLDRQRPLLGRRRAVAPAVHAAPQGQQLELDQHREGRPADGRGPDAAGRAGGVRAADRGEVGRLLVREPPPGGVQPGGGGGLPGRRGGVGLVRVPAAVVPDGGNVVGGQREAARDAPAAVRGARRGVRGRPDAEAPDAARDAIRTARGRVEGPLAVRAILAIADGRPKPGWPSGRDSSVGRARD